MIFGVVQHNFINDKMMRYCIPVKKKEKRKKFEAYLLVLQNIKPCNSMQSRYYYFGLILTLELFLKTPNQSSPSQVIQTSYNFIGGQVFILDGYEVYLYAIISCLLTHMFVNHKGWVSALTLRSKIIETLTFKCSYSSRANFLIKYEKIKRQ